MNVRRLVTSFVRIAAATAIVLSITTGLLFWSAIHWYPLNALLWHARHGKTAHVGKYSVPVSIWAIPETESPNSLYINLRPGKYEPLSVEYGRPVMAGNKLREVWVKNSKSADPRISKIAEYYLSLNTTNVIIADQSSFCYEETHGIRCVPEDRDMGLTVQFMGFNKSSRLLFYETLSKIKQSSNNGD